MKLKIIYPLTIHIGSVKRTSIAYLILPICLFNLRMATRNCYVVKKYIGFAMSPNSDYLCFKTITCSGLRARLNNKQSTVLRELSSIIFVRNRLCNFKNVRILFILIHEPISTRRAKSRRLFIYMPTNLASYRNHRPSFSLNSSCRGSKNYYSHILLPVQSTTLVITQKCGAHFNFLKIALLYKRAEPRECIEPQRTKQ